MQLETIVVGPIAGSSGDVTINHFEVTRKRSLRRVAVVASASSATSDASNYWTLSLVDKSDSDAVLATRATYSSGAADDMAAYVPYELTLADDVDVAEGHVLALLMDETGTATDLSAIGFTLIVEAL